MCSFVATAISAKVPLHDLQIDGSPRECEPLIFASNVQIPDKADLLAIFPSWLTDRDSNTLSGKSTFRYFCGECGSPIRTQEPESSGYTYIKMGLFAKQGLKYAPPVHEIFTVDRDDWEKPIEGAEQFDHGPK
jgi:Glutathione-dependent formaldehyde-activating enzyme